MSLMTTQMPCLLGAARNPPPNGQWHRPRPKIESLLPLQLPIRTWQFEIIPSNECCHENALLHVADVAPDAAPPACAKGNKGRLGPLSAVAEPPLGPELLGVVKYIRVAMRSVGRDGDRGATGDPLAVNVHTWLWGLAIQPKCDGRREPERLVEARPEVWKVSDGLVGGNDKAIRKSLIYFFPKT